MSGPSSRGAERSSKRTGMYAGVAALVTLIALGTYAGGLLSGLEDSTVRLRFSLRGSSAPKEILVVGVDNQTLDTLRKRWPFPRSLDARAVEIAHRDHARGIVYDVQFTQPTVAAEDRALYEAISSAPGVVLATTEIGPGGTTDVLGGAANLAGAHARAAAANFRANASGVIQKYGYSIGGLQTIAVSAARQAGATTLTPRNFDHGSAWIDYRGPPGTIPSVSFSSLVRGEVPPARVAGKIIVIGATSPVLQDIHSTSTTSSSGMSGPEVQANAIWTALHHNPLGEAPAWMTILATLIGGLTAPLACIRLRPLLAGAFCLALMLIYAVAAQLAFDAGLILSIVYPLLAAALALLGTLIVSYLAESWERQLSQRYGNMLEAEVTARTLELRDTQVEVVRRLARAAELRDEDTGQHVERVGRLCEHLAHELRMPARDAERLRIASALHDVGKIGVPDHVLLKKGELSDSEWRVMRAHTSRGASLLADSDSPLLGMAEEIAQTHHEWWDGSGYPRGLRGEEIPLVGRICAVCDVFDALSSRRSYKEPWPFDRVIGEITSKRGTHFDPALVDALLKRLPEFRREHLLAGTPCSEPDRLNIPAPAAEPERAVASQARP